MKEHLKQKLTKENKNTYEEIKKILEKGYCQNSVVEKLENIDVDINHLENIFSDETYYLAMKIVPLLERKVLYLLYVENIRVNDICKRLHLKTKDVIYLKNKGIIHFKNNLETLYKTKKLNEKYNKYKKIKRR